MREGDWICPECKNHNYASKTACNRCGIPKMLACGGGYKAAGKGGCSGGGSAMALPPNAREGDWMCTSCGNHNYASKTACNKCGVPKPAAYGNYGPAGSTAMHRNGPYGGGGGGAGGGNWNCPQCGNLNYPMRTECNRCGLPKHMAMQSGIRAMGMPMGMDMGMMGGMNIQSSPSRSMSMPSNMRPGDWMCPSCSNHNYASKTHCNKCGVPKETRIAKEGMREGDWICRQCANHNYASKTACNKCAAPKGDTPSHQANNARGKGSSREGDWTCPSCGNNNYANRTMCNRCGLAKT